MNTDLIASFEIETEKWPLAEIFTISRGSKSEAEVVVVRLEAKNEDPSAPALVGRGECVPYARYGESVESVIGQISSVKDQLLDGLASDFNRQKLTELLPAGAARNAIDCALWDLEAKSTGKGIFSLVGANRDQSVETVYTIGLGSPEEMAAKAAQNAHRPILKIKLGGENDAERMRAIRDAAPDCDLVVDANEGWTEQNLEENLGSARQCAIKLVEQPLPAGKDDILAKITRTVPVCADESAHTSHNLEQLADRYDAVNIKLDKTGGLTEGLAMLSKARELGLKVMVGCMVGTSLSMAPAFLLAQRADFVDIDGPLLLACDREGGLKFDVSTVYAPEPVLWG